MEEIIERFGDLSFSEKPRVPKGKRSAYGFFMQQFSADLKSKGQKSLGLGHFSKLCSTKWKELSVKEKDKYQRKSKEDISRYEKEMKEYEKEKYEYDQIIDELHDKGYLKHLEDKRHLKDLNTARTSNKAVVKRVNKMTFHRTLNNKKNMVQNNTDSDEDNEDNEDNSSNDTIEEMNGKSIVPQIQNNDEEEKDEEENGNDSAEDEDEEEEDNESGSEEEDEESDGSDEEVTVEEDDKSSPEEDTDNESGSDEEDGGDEEEGESSDEKEKQPKNNMRLTKSKPNRRLFK